MQKKEFRTLYLPVVGNKYRKLGNDTLRMGKSIRELREGSLVWEKS